MSMSHLCDLLAECERLTPEEVHALRPEIPMFQLPLRVKLSDVIYGIHENALVQFQAHQIGENNFMVFSVSEYLDHDWRYPESLDLKDFKLVHLNPLRTLVH